MGNMFGFVPNERDKPNIMYRFKLFLIIIFVVVYKPILLYSLLQLYLSIRIIYL